MSLKNDLALFFDQLTFYITKGYSVLLSTTKLKSNSFARKLYS